MAAKTSDPIDILLEMGIDLDNLSEEEDYLSALIEATNTLTIKDPSDPRIAPLQQEIIKVRKSRKAADPKFKAKKTTIKPDAFFDKKKPEEEAQPVPGQKALPGQQTAAIVKRQTISPEVFKRPEEPEVDDDKKKRVRKKTSDPLKDILKGVNSILATLKNQNKLTKKQAERDRKDAEKAKRGAQEDELETSPLKKFFAGAKKLAKPAISFFESIMQFIVKVLIGRLLVKILGWMGDPKNSKKMTAIMDFFRVTWPAFLAAFLAFQFGLGGFITGLLGLIGGFIPKLLGLIPKMLAGLGKLAMGNPLLVAAAAGAALFAMGKIIPEAAPQTVETETDKKVDENVKKKGGEQTATDLAEEQAAKQGERNAFQNFFFGTVMGEDAEYEKQTERAKTGKEPEYGKKFNKGGVVPGSGPNKDTVPAMLTPGEFVMSRGAVQAYGTDTLESMNAMGGGTNMPSLSFNAGGIVPGYNSGGEVKNPDEELKQNDEPNDRPKGDHTHDLKDIVGINKISGVISGMASKFAKSAIGNVLMPGVGPALSIAESLMGGPAQASEVKSSTSTPAPVTATPKTPAVSSSTKTEQPKKKGGNMFGGFMDAMTFNMFDFDGMGEPSSESTSPEKDDGGSPDKFAKDMIKVHEGLRLDKYMDSRGFPTIGYGHLIEPGESMPNRISQQKADELFDEDYAHHKAAAKKIPGYDKASAMQKAALIDLTFNMGPAWADGFPAFKKAFAAGNYEQAGNELIDSAYYSQVGRRGPTIVNLIKGKGADNVAYLKNVPKPIPGSGQSQIASADSGGLSGDTKPPAAQMKSSGGSKPLPPPSRGQKLSDLVAQQEARAGRGPSSGSSANAEGANPGALDTPNSNDLPPIDANAMVSMEKIKVLGLTVV